MSRQVGDERMTAKGVGGLAQRHAAWQDAQDTRHLARSAVGVGEQPGKVRRRSSAPGPNGANKGAQNEEQRSRNQQDYSHRFYPQFPFDQQL
jgi:hypothetical protein